MTSTTADPATMTTADVFERAADLIERDGLHCGDFYANGLTTRKAYPRGTPGCTITALVAVQYPDLPFVPLHFIEDFDADEHVIAFADHLGKTDPATIANWSDSHTADEVVAELRAAAQIAGAA